MRMATLRAPGAPVTSASPMVIMTASTLPAAKASIDGAYSNQSNLTSTPASLNQPFWMPISKAVHPGQSEKPMRRGLAASGGGGAGARAGAEAAGAAGGGAAVSVLQPMTMATAAVNALMATAPRGAVAG